MTWQFSLAHLTALHCSPPQLIEIAARAGYEFVGLRPIPVGARDEPLHPFATDRTLFARTKVRARRHGRSSARHRSGPNHQGSKAAGLPARDRSGGAAGRQARAEQRVVRRSTLHPGLLRRAVRPGAAVRSDRGPGVRDLVRHPHAERSSRARPRGTVRQRRHRGRHVALRSMSRRPGNAGLAAARMVSTSCRSAMRRRSIRPSATS